MSRSPRKSRRTPAPVIDPSTLPFFLLITDMAGLFRLAPDTILTKLSRGTFQPLPFDKYPYRWKRDDVIAYLAQPPVKVRSRKHGFAAAKVKRDRELALAGVE